MTTLLGLVTFSVSYDEKWGFQKKNRKKKTLLMFAALSGF